MKSNEEYISISIDELKKTFNEIIKNEKKKKLIIERKQKLKTILKKDYKN